MICQGKVVRADAIVFSLFLCVTGQTWGMDWDLFYFISSCIMSCI